MSSSKVTLYRFQDDPQQFCTSPFVNKLDALLTFSNLQNMKYAAGTIFQAPRGKLPFIGLDDTLIPDSEVAYNSCITKGLVQCLDRKAGLSDKEIAISRSMKALVECKLNEMIVYERWIENWYQTRGTFLAGIPALIRPPVGYLFVYRKVSAAMWSTGLARYSPEERKKYLEDDAFAFATLIPKSGYILGKATPSRIDAIAFGFLAALIAHPELSPKTTAEIHKYPHLLDYQNRLIAEFWPQRKQLL